MFVRRWVVAALAAALLAATAACQAGLPDARAQDGRLRVVTSFYPLRFLVEQINRENDDLPAKCFDAASGLGHRRHRQVRRPPPVSCEPR